MEDSPLQRFIKLALASAPEARDHYDKQIQRKGGTTGKPLYDIWRGKSKSPSLQTLTHIAEVLRQPLDLLTRACGGEVVDPVEWYSVEPDLPPVKAVTAGDGPVALRQIDLGLSMGDGTNIDHYADEGTIDFDAALIRSITRSAPHRLFVARGDGDSMLPTLMNDDLVVIDTGQTELNLTDRIWAISVFGAGGLKRLRPISASEVEVISDNPNHSNQTVSRQDLHIIGRLIWAGRRF
jgi:transcriptional regulator with XRE-family HTH domain